MLILFEKYGMAEQILTLKYFSPHIVWVATMFYTNRSMVILLHVLFGTVRSQLYLNHSLTFFFFCLSCIFKSMSLKGKLAFVLNHSAKLLY